MYNTALSPKNDWFFPKKREEKDAEPERKGEKKGGQPKQNSSEGGVSARQS